MRCRTGWGCGCRPTGCPAGPAAGRSGSIRPATRRRRPATPTALRPSSAGALAEKPPPAGERATVARFGAVGIGPDAPPPDGWQRAALESDGRQTMPLLGSSCGGDFRRRAVVAMQHIGALESREAIYPMAWRDAHGEPLTGRRAYPLRFAPGRLPPVDAFRSPTMHGRHDYLLVANPIDRHAVGDRTPGLQRDADGGLTIRIGHGLPDTEAARASRLPAPAGGFYPCLRAYPPCEEFLARPLPAAVAGARRGAGRRRLIAARRRAVRHGGMRCDSAPRHPARGRAVRRSSVALRRSPACSRHAASHSRVRP